MPATPGAAAGRKASLAHVPVGQLLGDVEGLPHIGVVEVRGGGCGVGAGGVHAQPIPRTQQCLGARTAGQGLRFLASPTPPPPRHQEKVHARPAHLMPCPLQRQASEDVAQVMEHNGVLLVPASEAGDVCLSLQMGAGTGPQGTRQGLP